MPIIERDPILKTFVNDNPERLHSFIEQTKWSSKNWVTYSFANRKFYDPVTTSRLGDDWVLSRFLHYYQRLARQTKKPIYPLVWISHEHKSLHMHAIELSQGITTQERCKAFHLHFKKFGKLPKDLTRSIIHDETYDPNKGALWYAAGGHNQVKTIIHKGHKKAQLPIDLMGKLDIELTGHAELLLSKNEPQLQTKNEAVTDDFTTELVRILSQY